MRVQVVDDNAALRAVACLEVELTDGLELAGSAGDGEEAIIVARRERPDVILLDLDMPVMGGLEALPELVQIVPDATIVVYTSDPSPATRQEVLRRGAHDYVIKGTKPLHEVLDLVRNGGAAGLAPA